MMEFVNYLLVLLLGVIIGAFLGVVVGIEMMTNNQKQLPEKIEIHELKWQPYNKDLIPNNCNLILRWSSGDHVCYYVDSNGKYCQLYYNKSGMSSNVTIHDIPIEMVITPNKQ